MRRSYTPKKRKNYLREALERVITESGLADDIDPKNGYYTEPQKVAWFKAKMADYIRRVKPAEVEAYLQNRRGVRTVLIAMATRIAENEALNPDNYGDDDTSNLKEYLDALRKVVGEIHEARKKPQGHGYWTLTPWGVAALEEKETASAA
jgi:hypothetical protein